MLGVAQGEAKIVINLGVFPHLRIAIIRIGILMMVMILITLVILMLLTGLGKL